MQEQGDDEHADNGRNADHERAEGLGLVAILRGHFAKVGDDPEVGVVGVRKREVKLQSAFITGLKSK